MPWIPMSSHFTEQSKVALARQLAWSKKSKDQSTVDEAYTHSLIQKGWFEARGGLPSMGQGPRKYHSLDLQAANPSPGAGPERWDGHAAIGSKIGRKRRPGRGVAKLSLEENFARAPAWQITEALRVTGCRFFIPPMQACTMHSLHPSAQLPGKSRHQRHEICDPPMEPVLSAHIICQAGR